MRLSSKSRCGMAGLALLALVGGGCGGMSGAYSGSPLLFLQQREPAPVGVAAPPLAQRSEPTGAARPLAQSVTPSIPPMASCVSR